MDRPHVAAASIMNTCGLVQVRGQRSEVTRAPTRSPRRDGRSRWRVGNTWAKPAASQAPPTPPEFPGCVRIYGTPAFTRNECLAVLLPSTTRLNAGVSRSRASPLKVTADPWPPRVITHPQQLLPLLSLGQQAPLSTPPPTQRQLITPLSIKAETTAVC